ncbi:MAG: DUF1624 domain-containing protein [Spirochaetes bacterium]|nr:DUF1624 domain-containing protein [Spirochaetota bacterium]
MKPHKERLRYLDLFRGITIFGMIVVNQQGDWGHVHPAIRHAAWNGLTPADLVFPFFLFIAGVSVFFSQEARFSWGDTTLPIALRIIRRGLLLIALGMFLNLPLDMDFSSMRIPGVLQRIGLCYLVVALVALGRRPVLETALCIVLPALYWILMLSVAVPGFGSGRLDPPGNLGRYVDSALFGLHTYRHAPVPGFDPEGALSTISAAATMLLGLLSGRWLGSASSMGRRAGGLAAAGVLILAVGLILTVWIPLNKNLWSPSYVAVTGGLAQMTMALSVLATEMQNRVSWGPFESLGRNSIAIYVLSSVAGICTAGIVVHGPSGAVSLKQLLYSSLFLPWIGGAAASLLYSLIWACLWTAAAMALRWRGLFIKL